MINILLVLIHNNDQQRLAYIKPKLRELCLLLKVEGYNAFIYEPDYRPEKAPSDVSTTLRQQHLYQNLGKEWRKYRRVQNGNPISKYLDLVNEFSISNQRRLRTTRDMIVARNHYLGWRQGVKSGADFVITFEDDVLFKEDSHSRISGLIRQANNGHWCFYADLAGGLEERDLQIRNLLSEAKGSFMCKGYKHYKKPVTNTACCYLINKQLSQEFVRIYGENKDELKLLGADWLMNALFLKINFTVNPCYCVHADPTVFVHGSMAGAYQAL